MAKKMPPYPLKDFSLGLIDKDDANMIPDEALADVQNAIIGRPTEKRHGYTRYTPTALLNPITKLYDFFKNDGTKEFLAVSNLTLYKDSAGTLGAIPFNTITALTSNDVKLMTYKNRSLADVTLIADTGKLKVYNGTDVAEVTPHTPTVDEQTDPGLNDLANLTKFRAIAIKKDRIFAAAHPTIKNRVSFCHHDPSLGYAVYDYWPATFFFDVATTENDEIVQLKVFRDALIVFCKRTSPWVLYGDGRTLADYQLHKINTPTGCIAPSSVTEVGNFLFYLSDDHVYALYSTDQNYVSAEIVSGNIEKTLKSISRADKEKATGYFHDNKYFLSFPDGTCLVYDTILKAWTKWTNVQANSFLNRDGVLYFGTDAGLIHKFDESIYNDDGVAISHSLTTKNLDLGFEAQEKKFKKLLVVARQYEGQSSSYNIKAVIDDVTISLADISTDISGEWDEGNWDNALWDFVDVVRNELKVKGKGYNIQFVISNNVLDEPFTLYAITLIYKLYKP
jgi:hypothetical protein